MAMTFLSQKQASASNDALELTAEQIEVEQQELAAEQQLLSSINLEARQNIANIEKVLTATDVATSLKENGVAGNIAGAVFGEQLAASGVPEDVAIDIATSVGTESDGEEIGNEVVATAKQIVMDIVNWLIGVWKDAKALMKRTFAKHFGSVKRNLAAWRKVKARVEGFMEEGRTLEDKSKLEIKRGGAFLIKGVSATENPKTPVTWAAMPGEVEAFDKIAQKLADVVEDLEPTDAGSLSELSLTASEIKKCGTFSQGELDVTPVTWDHGVAGSTTVGFGLLGRLAVLGVQKVNTSEIKLANDAALSTANESQLREIKKFVNGASLGIKPSHTKLKSLDEVKVSVATLDEIESLADAHIEMATNVLALETSKKIVKVEKAFDKAIDAAKKWSKDADSDNASDKRKAIAGAGMMAAILQYLQESSLGMVGDVVRHAGACGKAHGSVVSTMLGCYKKA